MVVYRARKFDINPSTEVQDYGEGKSVVKVSFSVLLFLPLVKIQS